jgi:hypothetical protein
LSRTVSDLPPKCPYCQSVLNLDTDVTFGKPRMMSRVHLIWCKKCGAILGGSVTPHL